MVESPVASPRPILRMERLKVDAAFFVTLMVTEALKPSRDSIEKANWPKDFFHALISQ